MAGIYVDVNRPATNNRHGKRPTWVRGAPGLYPLGPQVATLVAAPATRFRRTASATTKHLAQIKPRPASRHQHWGKAVLDIGQWTGHGWHGWQGRSHVVPRFLVLFGARGQLQGSPHRGHRPMLGITPDLD